MAKTESFTLLPGGENALFFSSSSNPAEQRCIGHMRGDFGRRGDEFWTTWWPHSANVYNDDAFKADFYPIVEMLRKNLLKSRASMYKYLAEHPATPIGGAILRSYGYHINTAHYKYYLRCMPELGDYNIYIYCYLGLISEREGDAHVRRD